MNVIVVISIITTTIVVIIIYKKEVSLPADTRSTSWSSSGTSLGSIRGRPGFVFVFPEFVAALMGLFREPQGIYLKNIDFI